ncbi:MAG: hypothetical protein HWE07_10325 [Cytophagia bacterium]|nr:hypothetical protein [Cytophagia bacterium]
MGKRVRYAIKWGFIFVAFLQISPMFGQEMIVPEVVNEQRFLKAIRSNITSIFAVNPYGNVDSVKYEGHYAVLKIKNGEVSQIDYPEKTQPLISRNCEFAIRDINNRIHKGEFELKNIDQILVSMIIEWVHFDTNEPNFHDALSKIFPKVGYTANTYVTPPILVLRGNPIRN